MRADCGREREGSGIGGRRGGKNEEEGKIEGMMRGIDVRDVYEGRVRECGCGCELIDMYV